jgi:antitoxin component YwqK of YwqJK toxin-antitoxin module
MKITKLKYIGLLTISSIIITNCASSTEEVIVEDERDYCECVELFFDEPYNYFYLEERSKPFTGTCESKNEKGIVIIKKTFEEGKLTGPYIEYFEDGTLLHEWNFLNNRQHGDQKIFNEKGDLILHSVYTKGDLDTIVFKK